ncbi:regulatory protein BlaR1 [Oxobacter pfennigii]|uniref:Regulatory protein BlaR1 n=1 Tax=Oxobacter pfennigii TaxID=36849 RepID=A0A0P8WM40_9CLOT|nr:M56 family metallopeptidase [Oxobacter pfennigii]KPU43555.1 regulatory protein BlaR1 [Oxobacter pfennigii]
MLDNLFVQILNMSYTASIAILFVIAARLALKKAPKIFSYALWSVVLFRLVFPFSFESMLSLIPNSTAPILSEIMYSQTPQINTGISTIDNVINSSLPAPIAEASVNPLQIWIFIGEIIWIAGIASLILYSLISLINLKNRLKDSKHEKDNVYIARHLGTPFVLGIIRPKIYLPANLSEAEKEYILLHERIHIKRFDHVIKMFSFLLLCIHWFNPLVWIAFSLCTKDMEMSCDEAVIRRLGSDIKKSYSSSLLALTSGRRILSGVPLAFGEVDTKGRIKNILNFKKPQFWVTVIALIAVFGISFSLMANPKTQTSFNGATYRVEEIIYDAPRYSFAYTTDTAPVFTISSDYVLFSKEPAQTDWVMHNSLYKYNIKRQELYSLFQPLLNNVHEKIDQAKLVYRADTNDQNNTFYLVIQLKNGDILLAHAYDSPSDSNIRSFNPHIRWLFKLKNISEVSVESLWKLRTPYVGNNSAVGGIINELVMPDHTNYDSFELQTRNPPYKVTVILKTNTQALDYYTGIMNQKPFLINACIMFSLIENADIINFTLYDGVSEPYTIEYTRDYAESIAGADLWEESKTFGKFKVLLDRISEHVDKAIQPIAEEKNVGNSNQIPDIEAKSFNDYPDYYPPEQGEEDGMFVVVHGKVHGSTLNVWEKFLASIKNKEFADITILQYTIEGDPIFTHVIYDVAGYQVLTDSSRDKFAGEDAKKTHISEAPHLTIINNEGRTTIYLTEKENLTLEQLKSDSTENGLVQAVVSYNN